MYKSIEKFKNTFVELLNKTDKIVCKRKSKITFKDVFYYMTNLISDEKESSVTVTTSMRINEYTCAKKDAFIKKRLNIKHNIFDDISNELLNYYHCNFDLKKFKNYQVFSVDGTFVDLSKNIQKEGYKLTKNNTYSSSLISGLYDNLNNIVIDLNLSKIRDERKSYLEQFKYIKSNNIVIHDRGYYSEELLYELHKLGAKSVFRLKKNFLILRNLEQCDDIVTNIEHNNVVIPFRIIKYQIKIGSVTNVYFIGTTLVEDKYSLNDIKDLYGHRWSIEEYFKHAKSYGSLREFHTKSENLIKQEIYMHKCISIISKILQKCHIDNSNNTKIDVTQNKINLKNFIKKLPALIGIMIYEDAVMDKIIRIIKILCENLTKIVNGRKHERIRIKPPSLWYHKKYQQS